MKKKFTFSVMALLLSMTVTVWANAPVSLLVHQTSGSIYSAALQDVSKLSFDAGDLVIQTASAQKIPLAGIQKITFGEATAVADVVAVDCKAFVNENDVLIVNAEQAIYNLQIVSLTGQVMVAQQYADQPHYLEMDVQSLTQGTYLVLLQTVNGTANAKVMIR